MSETTKQTFSEWIEDGGTMPMVLDNATWELLQDWFQLRYVKKNFDVFFDRQVTLHYPRYIQMLRIDPVDTDYDWFISQYYEHQLTNNTSNNDLTYVDGSVKTTVAQNSATGVVTTDSDVTKSNDSGVGTNVSNGSTTGTLSDTTITTNSDISKSQGSNRTIQHTRENPDAASYDTDDLSDFNTTIGVDGETVSSHSHGIANPTITNPTTSGDGYAMTGAVEKSDRTGESVKSQKSTGTHTDNSTDTFSTSGTVTKTGNGTSDTTYTQEGTTEQTNETGTKASGQRDTVVRELTKGRNDELALMAERAKAYIAGTSAWLWFYHEIDKCFIQDLEFDEV